MYIDSLLIFEPVAGTAITSTADSTNKIDLLNARDIGVGDDPSVLLEVRALEAFTAAGSATLTIALQMSADDSTYYTVAQTGAIPKASLIVGRAWQIAVPVRPVELGDTVPRYMKLVYTVATGPFTAGKLFAGLVIDRQANRAYAPGIAISN